MNETVNRAGAKTSEFWLILAFFVVVLANGTRWVDISSDDLYLLAGLVGGNLAGRTMLKNTLAKAGKALPAGKPSNS